MNATPGASTTGGPGVLAGPGQGATYRPLGLTLILKAGAEDTGRACEVLEGVFPAGEGFGAHIHHHFAEAFWVLEGEITLRVGDRTATAGAGSFGVAPRETVHAFRNGGTGPCRLLFWFVPGYGKGLEGYLAALAGLPAGASPDAIRSVLEEYDTILVAPQP